MPIAYNIILFYYNIITRVFNYAFSHVWYVLANHRERLFCSTKVDNYKCWFINFTNVCHCPVGKFNKALVHTSPNPLRLYKSQSIILQ